MDAEGVAMRTGTGSATGFGLSEEELRERLAEELTRAMRAEGNAPTIHAIAHSIARVIEDDHLRMLEQLDRAGVRVE
jgi:hypothetical protein